MPWDAGEDCGKDEGKTRRDREIESRESDGVGGKMNNLIACAEEIVVREVVYV